MPDIEVSMLEAALAVLAAALAAIAVKVGISFDLNRWREERHRRAGERLQALCTHTRVFLDEEGRRIGVESFMMSPAGRLDWECSRCRFTTDDPHMAERHTRYWAENLDEWRRREKAFVRAYRRLYKVPR